MTGVEDRGQNLHFLTPVKLEGSAKCPSELVYCCVRVTSLLFFGALQIVSPLEDTCVDIYKVENSALVHEQSQFLEDTFETFKYTIGLGYDLTGYFVNSTKPIAIYAGHSCAFVPDDPLTMFCDHIVEQIPPVNELGLEHIIPPILGRDPNAGYVQTLT